jgi:hypothetical protein
VGRGEKNINHQPGLAASFSPKAQIPLNKNRHYDKIDKKILKAPSETVKMVKHNVRNKYKESYVF